MFAFLMPPQFLYFSNQILNCWKFFDLETSLTRTLAGRLCNGNQFFTKNINVAWITDFQIHFELPHFASLAESHRIF